MFGKIFHSYQEKINNTQNTTSFHPSSFNPLVYISLYFLVILNNGHKGQPNVQGSHLIRSERANVQDFEPMTSRSQSNNLTVAQDFE